MEIILYILMILACLIGVIMIAMGYWRYRHVCKWDDILMAIVMSGGLGLLCAYMLYALVQELVR